MGTRTKFARDLIELKCRLHGDAFDEEPLEEEPGRTAGRPLEEHREFRARMCAVIQAARRRQCQLQQSTSGICSESSAEDVDSSETTSADDTPSQISRVRLLTLRMTE